MKKIESKIGEARMKNVVVCKYVFLCNYERKKNIE